MTEFSCSAGLTPIGSKTPTSLPQAVSQVLCEFFWINEKRSHYTRASPGFARA